MVTEKQKANLIPFNKLTQSEHRELAVKGGKASGKARNWRAEIQENIGKSWDMEVTNPKQKSALRKVGLPTTLFGLWLYNVLHRSSSNPQTLRIVLELIDALNTQQNNVTVNAVPIIIGGEDELK